MGLDPKRHEVFLVNQGPPTEFAAAVFQVKPNGDVKRLEAAGLLIEQQLEWGA